MVSGSNDYIRCQVVVMKGVGQECWSWRVLGGVVRFLVVVLMVRVSCWCGDNKRCWVTIVVVEGVKQQQWWRVSHGGDSGVRWLW
ncbi:hypothetical protein SESBI_03333 [Sesbania bispinosa]|nr:hypothetical protein SESBI_03333 [Sesbania bispinosa]